jgi:tetratricopeptide (TPR) repeat protein
MELGQYDGALAMLEPFWDGIGVEVRIAGLSDIARAELLLCAGTLTERLGSAQQFPGAGPLAKDLLSEAQSLCESLGAREEQAAAMIELAICYWRGGELDEAHVILESVLSLLGERSQSLQRARAIYNLAMVLGRRGRHHDALQYLLGGETLLDSVGGDVLRGKFRSELALALRNVGFAEQRPDYLDRALIEMEAASFHFEQAGTPRFIASVQNNLGELYLALGRHEDARRHLMRARAIAITLNDHYNIAEFDDTLAHVYLAEQQPAAAAQVARAALESLESGGEQLLYVRIQTTYGIALARQEQKQQAHEILEDAREMALQIGDVTTAATIALTLIEELGETFSAPESLALYTAASNNLGASEKQTLTPRLLNCAEKVLATFGLEMDLSENGNGITLKQKIQRYEAYLINQALRETDGQVTRAARSLGVKHQHLIKIIQRRHSNLLTQRLPPRQRRRSIINKDTGPKGRCFRPPS